MYEAIYKDIIPLAEKFKIYYFKELLDLVKMSQEQNWGFSEAEAFLMEYYDRMNYHIKQEFEDNGLTPAKTF